MWSSGVQGNLKHAIHLLNSQLQTVNELMDFFVPLSSKPSRNRVSSRGGAFPPKEKEKEREKEREKEGDGREVREQHIWIYVSNISLELSN